MAREIQVDMSRESVDLEDLSSRLAHKKVCNINLKRNQNTLLKGLEVINELVKRVGSMLRESMRLSVLQRGLRR